jgi:hypothetical protein
VKRYEEATVLSLGARGRLGRAAFTLAGRTLVRSKSGGVWNEWTMRFDDGTTRFLAEARGTFTVFEPGALAPAWDALRAGAPLDTGFVVAERGEAERIARWGETPDAPKTYRYADLSSRDGTSATIDWSETPPVSFVGRRTSLADLGLTPRPERPRFVPLAEAPRPKGLETWLDVGDEGTWGRARFRVTAVLYRSARSGRERYTWEEYVLFDPAAGFRWLVVSDGHWSLVEAIEPGLVVETARGATLGRDAYEPLGAGRARIEWATGELPWEAAIGDTVDVRDYVHAPYMLSCEAGPDEITWSRGEYVDPGTVARVFGKRVLPEPEGRAPHQPKKKTRPNLRR